ncbi:MAG: hypothetical protein AAF184_14375 [Pseudomonadota bacterium]
MHKTTERNTSSFAAPAHRVSAGAIGMMQVPLTSGECLNRAIAEHMARKGQGRRRDRRADAARPFVPARPAHVGEG